MLGEAPFQATRVRVSILVSFVCVIVAALPFWWATTTITRLPLPAADVLAWQEQVVRRMAHAGLSGSRGFFARACAARRIGGERCV